MATDKAPKEEVVLDLQENSDGSFTVSDAEPLISDDGTTPPVEKKTGQAAEGEGADGAAGAATGDEVDDDHDDDDAPLVTGGSSNEELEAKRARRAAERKRKKDAQRSREDGLRSQLDSERSARRQLEERIGLIERKTDGADLAQLDGAMKRAADSAAYYKSIISEATKKQDGDAVAEATERMIAARNEESRLKSIRQAYTQRQTQPAAPDPQLAAHAQTWMGKHRWYNPQGNDMDSRVTLAVDASVQQEGFDPRTPGYWNELDNRLKKVLPHRFTGGTGPADDAGDGGDTGGTGTSAGNSDNRGTAHSGKQGTPVAGSSREGRGAQGANGSAKTYQLSKDRVDALKEAGLWDDPVARAKSIREFHAYDRKNAGRS